jgi:hypothetical protein
VRVYLAAVFSMGYLVRDTPPLLHQLLDECGCKKEDMYFLMSYANFPSKQYEAFFSTKDPIVDSGAFSIMFRPHFTVDDLRAFARRYARFVRDFKVKNFVELDIDGKYGTVVYEDIMKEVHDIVGREAVPVFHRWRGKQYFLDLVKTHKFIMTGDVAIKGGLKDGYQYFNWFIDEAHKAGCRIHGLGYTTMPGLRKFDWDSVDSSSWASGIRFGTTVYFNGHGMHALANPAKDTHRVNTLDGLQRNFKEWVKFANYMKMLPSRWE